MKWRGSKTRGWEKVRAELSRLFFLRDLTYCELRLPGCWVFNGLGFSHFNKRRKLSAAQLYDVCLLCNVCHDKIENLPEAEKIRIHERIVEARGWQPNENHSGSNKDRNPHEALGD